MSVSLVFSLPDICVKSYGDYQAHNEYGEMMRSEKSS